MARGTSKLWLTIRLKTYHCSDNLVVVARVITSRYKSRLSIPSLFSFCFHLQTYQILSEAKKSDAEKRERLLEVYSRTEEFLDQLDTDFIKTLQKRLGDFKTTLKKNISDVKPGGQYIVLVAGKMIQLLLYVVCLRI